MPGTHHKQDLPVCRYWMPIHCRESYFGVSIWERIFVPGQPIPSSWCMTWTEMAGQKWYVKPRMALSMGKAPFLAIVPKIGEPIPQMTLLMEKWYKVRNT